MGKIRTKYRGFTASDLYSRTSAVCDKIQNTNDIDCTNISTSRVRTVIGAGSNSLYDLCRHDNVNKWSGFSPYLRSRSATPDIRGNGSVLVHDKPTACKLGDFAGYNHSAPTPYIYNSNHDEPQLIVSGGSGIFDCAVVLGELNLMNGDISGQSQVLGLAFAVWDGNTLIGSHVQSLSSFKSDNISTAFQVTKTNITSTKAYTCQIRLVSSSSQYNYNPTNVICGITELADYTKEIQVLSPNHFYFNAPYSSFPPTGTNPLVFGDWRLGTASWNTTNGNLVFQYIQESVRAHTGLHITAYVEQGYYNAGGSWIGTQVTDETTPSALWDGNWTTGSAVGNTNLLIWKSGGSTMTLPVPGINGNNNGYGFRVVIKCNPNQ